MYYSTSVADMFVLVCSLDASQSISVKGWFEDHGLPERQGHGKKCYHLNPEPQNFTVRSAKIYAPLLPECRSKCLRITAVSTVIKLLKAGLKRKVTRSICVRYVK